jgi:hypothetical protein
MHPGPFASHYFPEGSGWFFLGTAFRFETRKNSHSFISLQASFQENANVFRSIHALRTVQAWFASEVNDALGLSVAVTRPSDSGQNQAEPRLRVNPVPKTGHVFARRMACLTWRSPAILSQPLRRAQGRDQQDDPRPPMQARALPESP